MVAVKTWFTCDIGIAERRSMSRRDLLIFRKGLKALMQDRGIPEKHDDRESCEVSCVLLSALTGRKFYAAETMDA